MKYHLMNDFMKIETLLHSLNALQMFNDLGLYFSSTSSDVWLDQSLIQTLMKSFVIRCIQVPTQSDVCVFTKATFSTACVHLKIEN